MWSCVWRAFRRAGRSASRTRRGAEAVEEAGIELRPGEVSSTAQPWPFPMSLMIGCLAEALSEDITMDARRAGRLRAGSTKEEMRRRRSMRQHPDGTDLRRRRSRSPTTSSAPWVASDGVSS